MGNTSLHQIDPEGRRERSKGHPPCANCCQITPGQEKTDFLVPCGMEKEQIKPCAGIQDNPPNPAR